MKNKRLQSQEEKPKKRKRRKKRKANNNSRLLKLTDFPRIYREFVKDLPKEALRVETLGDDTDILLYGYQFVINRLNEVVGFNHWNYKVIGEPDKEMRDHFWWVSLSLELSLGNWIDGEFKPLVSKFSYGSGIHESLGNALKGALTNGFKKAAAMYGIGKRAYEGLIEDYDIQKKTKEKVVKVKDALSKTQLATIKEFEVILINVKNKLMLDAAKEEFKKLESKLDNKQIKYCKKLINRLEKKLKK